MYSIYAKTSDGKIIKGTSPAADPAQALAEAHASAKAGGLTIVKATVKFLENKSAFSVVAARGKKDADTPAPATSGKGATGTRGKR